MVDPCCVDSTDYLTACLDLNDTVTGEFSAVPDEPGEWTLTTADGTTHQLWLEGEGLGETLRPDLAALGTVVVSGQACGMFGEEYQGGTFTIYDQGGTLLFALGNRPDGVASTLDGAVTAGPDTCPDRPPGPEALSETHCFETIRNYPLEFTDGATSIALYQGESGELAGVEITVLLAMEAGEPTYQCSDVVGGWANWVMTGTGA